MIPLDWRGHSRSGAERQSCADAPDPTCSWAPAEDSVITKEDDPEAAGSTSSISSAKDVDWTPDAGTVVALNDEKVHPTKSKVASL